MTPTSPSHPEEARQGRRGFRRPVVEITPRRDIALAQTLEALQKERSCSGGATYWSRSHSGPRRDRADRPARPAEHGQRRAWCPCAGRPGLSARRVRQGTLSELGL